MIASIRRTGSIYGAVAANAVKLTMAYSIWFWVELLGQILMMTVFVFFWQAVYASKDTISGMHVSETLNYILLAQVLAPLVRWSLIMDFGYLVREGNIAVELVRPLDLQARWYTEWTTSMLVSVVRQAAPLAVIAFAFFHLRLTTDPVVWLYFITSFLLGNAVLFCFDYAFGCLAFYSTEVWGLHVLREGIASFFSGALIPLQMLPGWLQKVGAALPFGQALNAPISILTGITPITQASRLLVTEVIWLVCMFTCSRLFFKVASRKVTVQGG
jgi:ABC-2 type transport system permease protein